MSEATPPLGGSGWPDPCVDVGPDGVIRGLTPSFARLVDWPAAALVGAACLETLRPRAPSGRLLLVDGWPPAARLRSVRGFPEQEVWVRRADGAELALGATGLYLRDAAGRLIGVRVAVRPLRWRAVPSAHGVEIVSTVAHELRSPLTSVKGYTGLLLERWERFRDDQRRLMLEQVHRDADRVTRLIGELLDISRLETGRMVLRRRPVDLEELAADVVAKVALEFTGLDATLRFDRGFPKVWADPDKITQVLTNLVENACKYGSEHGLEITGTDRPGWVEVAVTDQGRGLSVGDLERVFTKFYRAGGARPSGSGLGLWISRGLIEAHGGTLTAGVAEGGGAVFRFSLPLLVEQ